jgi:hypothetical protein
LPGCPAGTASATNGKLFLARLPWKKKNLRALELLLFWLRLLATTSLVKPQMQGRICAE